jgi:hypothetical protein
MSNAAMPAHTLGVSNRFCLDNRLENGISADPRRFGALWQAITKVTIKATGRRNRSEPRNHADATNQPE